MTERNRKILVFGVLLVAIIWGAWNLMPHGNGDSAEELVAGQSDPDPDAAIQQAAITTPRAFSTDSLTWKEDPFARRSMVSGRSKTSKPEISFQLAAISAQAENAMALINGNVVRVGDEVAGWEVATIEPQSVLLRQGKRSRRITMKGQ